MALINEDGRSESRIRIVYYIFIALFVIYTARLFAMQIIEVDTHRSRADTITRRGTVLPAARGEIYTREYSAPVVFNSDSFVVNISPAETGREELDSVITKLSELLEVPREFIEKKVPARSVNLFRPIEAVSNVRYEKIAVLAEHVDILPGVSWQPRPIRNYEQTGSLSHVIGYVGDITRDELTMFYNKGYGRNDIIGKAGIERRYDDVLRGTNGIEMQIVDVRGRPTGEIARHVPPSPGKDIVLTIDRDIQELAAKALGERVGAVVVLRPVSGEVLAMVSYPWYDPSVFLNSYASVEYQNLVNDKNKPLINRAIQSQYAPGSTFKVIMTTGILAENAFPPDKTVECPGEISYGDRLWHCHLKKPGHGRLSLHRALAQSCDIYYWVVGRDYLGIDNIVSYSQDYGFGKPTEIDLPGEVSGFVPTPQWKDRRYHEKWLGGDTMNVSIGQGAMLVSPIQMANMVAMAVNGGVIYKPYILKEVRDGESGKVIEQTKPEVLHRSEVDPGVFERVREDMRGVISEGTARYPVDTVRVTEIAGKTGTSEVGWTDRWHSWFAAFAPYVTDNPEERVVVSVIVEAVNDWEWWAPYAQAIIFQGIFARQTYEEAVASLPFRYLQGLRQVGRRE